MNETRPIAIVGAGLMGRGIAQACAQAGYRVSLVDLEEGILQKAFDIIKSNLNTLVENEFITAQEAESTLPRIKGSLNLEEVVKDVDFVVEAVPEVLDLKRQVFEQLDKLCAEHVLLLTNASSIRTSDIAAATSRPDKVAGFHWVNPPYLIPVVEIIRGEKTSDSAINAVKELTLKLGKVPVVCKEVPGFLLNRLQTALLNEAIYLLEEGIASAEDIDNVFRLAAGIRLPFWGPLKVHDLVANKRTSLSVQEYLYRETGKDKFRPTNLLRQKVERGELGLTSGKGWYDFSGASLNAITRERDRLIIRMLKLLKEEGLA